MRGGRCFAHLAMEDQSFFGVHTEALGSLMQINQSASAFAGDQLERAVEHALAIAKRSAENVSSEAMRVHAHHHRTSSVFHVSLDQSNVRLAVELVLKSDHAEFTVTRRQHRFT